MATIQESKDAKTIMELESELARWRTSATYAKQEADDLYDKRRALENAIRRHASGECGCKSSGACMAKLVSLVPVNPRLSRKELRRRMQEKIKMHERMKRRG